MAGGARVVPIDYRMSEKALELELSQLNGVYIPGDTRTSFEDPLFNYQVGTILSWAQDHNSDESRHFPVVGMGYGYLSMLQSQFRFDEKTNFEEFPEWMVGASLEQNLNLVPKETFVYDEWAGHELESMLDKVEFYNELDMGVPLEVFNFSKHLKVFVPVATYEGGKDTHHLDEFVSMIEGTVQPFFGFGYRLDKVQFGFHALGGSGQSNVDHSKFSVEHAQHVANFLVDEARLSGNFYEWTNTEQERLISNYDSRSLSLRAPASGQGENLDFYRTELYLFQ